MVTHSRNQVQETLMWIMDEFVEKYLHVKKRILFSFLFSILLTAILRFFFNPKNGVFHYPNLPLILRASIFFAIHTSHKIQS